jgi:hypothetical protein
MRIIHSTTHLTRLLDDRVDPLREGIVEHRQRRLQQNR